GKRAALLLFVTPDAEAEAFEVDVFGFFAFTGAVLLDADAKERPETEFFAGVVVAVAVAVVFQEPAPEAALAAHLGFLLPSFHHPVQGLQRRPEGLGILNAGPALVRLVFGLGLRQSADDLKEPVLQ